MQTPQDGVAALVAHLIETGTRGAKLDAFRDAPVPATAKTPHDGAAAALAHARGAIGRVNPATVAKAEKFVASLLTPAPPAEKPAKGGKGDGKNDSKNDSK